MRYDTMAHDSRDALLRRAVEISLMSWRRAEPSDTLDDANRQGWWGDGFPSVAGDQIGSRLWELRRCAITAEVLRQAEDFCREALAWMIDDGWVSAVDVCVARANSPAQRDRVAARVVLTDAQGVSVDVNFDDLWRVLDAVPTSLFT